MAGISAFSFLKNLYFELSFHVVYLRSVFVVVTIDMLTSILKQKNIFSFIFRIVVGSK